MYISSKLECTNLCMLMRPAKPDLSIQALGLCTSGKVDIKIIDIFVVMY